MQHVLSAGALAALALTLSMTAAPSARAATVETFDGATPSNSAYFNAPIPGTGLEVVDGYTWVAQADADHGHILDLASGWYSYNFDSQANVGSTTVRSTQAFDLLAGTTYTLQFDYSRQTFSEQPQLPAPVGRREIGRRRAGHQGSRPRRGVSACAARTSASAARGRPRPTTRRK